jgi:mono/diheme cytochrome c family protein
MTKRTLSIVVTLIMLGAVLIGMSTVEATPPRQFDDEVAQGEYIVTIAGCASCHTPYEDQYNQPELSAEQLRNVSLFEAVAQDREEQWLAGGRPFLLGPAGTIYSPNITPDEETGIGEYSDEELKTALKTGVNREGKRMHPIMPSYAGMAESDLEALIAYLRTVEPVENEVEAFTDLPIPPWPEVGAPAEPPSVDDLSARGRYLVEEIGKCSECHTPLDPATSTPIMERFLSGGQPFEGPWGIVYPGNITPHDETGIGEWSDDQIKRVLTQGVRIDGRRIFLMPWEYYTSMTADDLDAVVHYLQNDVAAVENSVPP